jgi:zinc protease
MNKRTPILHRAVIVAIIVVSVFWPRVAVGQITEVATVEGITEYALPNGLRVLLFPDPSQPTTTVNITYLVGSRHEAYGETGMAHLLEHLVFKGTPDHPDIPQELTERGAMPNGTTWFDRTNYFETFPATDENLEWALDLEADRMVNSFISGDDLESEMTVVRNEMEAGENSPFNILMQRTLSASYLWHNYGNSTIGARADVENVPIERLQGFYRKYYQPDNAVLVIGGKFEPERALEVVEEKFGPIPRPDRTGANRIYPTYTAEPTQDGERSVTLRRVGDVQLVMAAYHVPPGSHDEYAAVQVMAHALTDRPSRRFHKSLVETGMASNIGARAYQLKEAGPLLIFAEVREEKSLADAWVTMDSTLTAFVTEEPITDEEVQRARTDLVKNIELNFNVPERIALQLSEWASMGDWRLFFLHRDRLEAVTTVDIRRVASNYLKPQNRTVGRFIPTDEPDRAEVPAAPDVNELVIRSVHRQRGVPHDPDHVAEWIPDGLAAEGVSRRQRGSHVPSALWHRVESDEQDGGRADGRGNADAWHDTANSAGDKRRVRPAQGAGVYRWWRVVHQREYNNHAPELA